LFPWVSL